MEEFEDVDWMGIRCTRDFVPLNLLRQCFPRVLTRGPLYLVWGGVGRHGRGGAPRGCGWRRPLAFQSGGSEGVRRGTDERPWVCVPVGVETPRDREGEGTFNFCLSGTAPCSPPRTPRRVPGPDPLTGRPPWLV